VTWICDDDHPTGSAELERARERPPFLSRSQQWRQAQKFADDPESESAVVDSHCARVQQAVVAVIDLFAVLVERPELSTSSEEMGMKLTLRTATDIGLSCKRSGSLVWEIVRRD
jgi:hypothetical protein